MKNLFKIANWCVVRVIVDAKNIIVNYKFDARFGCTCSRCGVSDVDYLFLKLRQHFYFCRARFFSQPE